mgnify:CR=1 FL=1|tara:strand:- start:1772 stop:2284 length:513 start_codon:yes stop_codon:yes gene_type:complete
MKKILILPHPMLRQKASRIKEVTKKEIEISENMQELLKKAPGVGLAANQIGILKEIVVINFEDKEQKLNKNYVLFNPEIISFSKETVIMEEGCLSLPQQYADIERPSSIKIKYKDETNKIIEENKSGFEARILQHEIDHLSGKLFIDFLSSLRRNKIIKRIKKLKKMGAI